MAKFNPYLLRASGQAAEPVERVFVASDGQEIRLRGQAFAGDVFRDAFRLAELQRLCRTYLGREFESGESGDPVARPIVDGQPVLVTEPLMLEFASFLAFQMPMEMADRWSEEDLFVVAARQPQLYLEIMAWVSEANEARPTETPQASSRPA